MGLNQWRLRWLTLAQFLIRLAQIAALAIQRLHLLGNLAEELCLIQTALNIRGQIWVNAIRSFELWPEVNDS